MDYIVLYKDEGERREAYTTLEHFERGWACTYDRTTRKAILLAYLRDIRKWRCRKNAGIWTLLEMLFFDTIKLHRLLIGHDQQLAEVLEEVNQDDSSTE